jgi:hypothetical protein
MGKRTLKNYFQKDIEGSHEYLHIPLKSIEEIGGREMFLVGISSAIQGVIRSAFL